MTDQECVDYIKSSGKSVFEWARIAIERECYEKNYEKMAIDCAKGIDPFSYDALFLNDEGSKLVSETIHFPTINTYDKPWWAFWR